MRINSSYSTKCCLTNPLLTLTQSTVHCVVESDVEMLGADFSAQLLILTQQSITSRPIIMADRFIHASH